MFWRRVVEEFYSFGVALFARGVRATEPPTSGGSQKRATACDSDSYGVRTFLAYRFFGSELLRYFFQRSIVSNASIGVSESRSN